ncbi:MAG: hypothetical protein HN509_10225 [Halobacteriovoraceae bacterium]|jgi:hypothetical protein|nr:hypothetical protein [Halobacteriovoraceae bacterium]MBT5095049.1 hypothetical protein [Halobacteriovoraceae bacterium]
MKLAFLSFDKPLGFTIDDELTIPEFEKAGHQVQTVSWNSGCDWSQFDAVIIRSTWDYQDHWDDFIEVLTKIDSETILLNPLETVKWNINKSYMQELSKKGVPIIPTLWPCDLAGKKVAEVFQELAVEKIIFKPLVGANADDTYPLTIGQNESLVPSSVFEGGFMAQPFIGDVIATGEYSLFYFNGEFSHIVLKTPCEGDYRVQEEHGGIISTPEASPQLLSAGGKVIDTLAQKLLYARVDLVDRGDGVFYLMELELIEPALYFRMNKNSPANFVRAFNQKLL